MNKLFICACLVVFVSCNVTKRNARQTQSKTDSTTASKFAVSALNKSDSNAVIRQQKNTVENGTETYRETTTVKEYFNDENDYVGRSLRDTVAPKKRGLKYRETTTTREGNRWRQANTQEQTAATGAKQAISATTASGETVATVKQTSKSSEKVVSKTKAFPGWGWVLVACFIVFSAVQFINSTTYGNIRNRISDYVSTRRWLR